MQLKKLSQKLLADVVIKNRKNKQMTQSQLSNLTGINRTMIGRIENEDYIPSIEQLQILSEILDFNFTELFKEDRTSNSTSNPNKKRYCSCWNWLCGIIYSYSSSSTQPCNSC